MRIYLAAPWIDRLKMPEISAKFETQGHAITHKWWLTEDIKESDRTVELLREQAQNDFNGVKNCQVLIVFNTAKSEGKATEQGIALADGKPIIAVGKRGEVSANVFQYLSQYKWAATVEEALDIMATIKWLFQET